MSVFLKKNLIKVRSVKKNSREVFSLRYCANAFILNSSFYLFYLVYIFINALKEFPSLCKVLIIISV